MLPDEAPLADDVDLDFLATQFKLSGGAIRNCSLAAAFRAADEDGEIAMRHLVRAVAQEYGKQGRLTLEADFERFHGIVRGPRRRVGDRGHFALSRPQPAVGGRGRLRVLRRVEAHEFGARHDVGQEHALLLLVGMRGPARQRARRGAVADHPLERERLGGRGPRARAGAALPGWPLILASG